MAKRKETFFERLAKKNAQHENKNDNKQNQKTKKRKSWKIFVIGSILTAAVIVGITVPLVTTSAQTKYIDPLPGNTVVYTFTTPSNTKVNFSIAQIEKNDKEPDQQLQQEELSQVNKLAIYYLYDKEVSASKEFQRLWNASRKANEKESHSLALKTIDQLKSQYKSEILDLKDNTVKKYGYSNWETKFNEILVKTYDGAKTIDQAVENKVFKQIKTDALKRFRLTTKNVNDLIDRVANNDIYEIGKDGNPDPAKILFHKGDKVFPWLKQITDNSLDGNYFKVGDQYIGFMTESFEPSQKSAAPFVKSYLQNDDPYLISQFTLPGVAKVKNDDSWTVDKTLFKYLMYSWPIRENSQDKPIYSYNMVQEYFKPFSSYVELLNQNSTNALPLNARYYSDVLNKLSNDSNAIKANFGTSGLTSLTTLFSKSDDNLKAFAILPQIIMGNQAIPEVDLFATFKEIQDSILSDQNIAPISFEQSDTLDQKKEKITKYNEAIQNAFEKADEDKDKGLFDKKYKQLITDKIAQLFDQGPEVDGNKQLFTLYKLKDTTSTYVILTANGITLIDIQGLINSQDEATTLEEQTGKIVEMIQNDYLLNDKYKQLTGVKYNALAAVNKNLTTDTYVNKIMLADQNFVDYLKTQTNIYAKDASGKLISSLVDKNNKSQAKQLPKYVQNDIDNLIAVNTNIMNSNNAQKALQITKDVNSWMQTRAQNGADANFIIKENKVYFVNNNKNYSETAGSVLNNELQKKLKVFQNR